jgi:hypothetical protein
MRCDSQASLLACNLASPCLGHELKAKVVTETFYNILSLISKKKLIVIFIHNFAKKKFIMQKT